MVAPHPRSNEPVKGSQASNQQLDWGIDTRMILEFPSFPIGSAFLECRYETRKLALISKAETSGINQQITSYIGYRIGKRD